MRIACRGPPAVVNGPFAGSTPAIPTLPGRQLVDDGDAAPRGGLAERIDDLWVSWPTTSTTSPGARVACSKGGST